MNAARKALLEKRDGWDIGRDPRQVTQDELLAAGHKPMSPLKALRLRCLDCCAEQPSEVRRCTAVGCPSWPFRMGNAPWRNPMSEDQREARRQAGERLAARAGNPRRGIGVSPNSAPPATTLPGDATLKKIDDKDDDSGLAPRAAAGGAR